MKTKVLACYTLADENKKILPPEIELELYPMHYIANHRDFN